MRPECFGVEFYDESGVECPHLECLLRQECGKTHQSAMGLFEEKKIKEMQIIVALMQIGKLELHKLLKM